LGGAYSRGAYLRIYVGYKECSCPAFTPILIETPQIEKFNSCYDKEVTDFQYLVLHCIFIAQLTQK